MRRGCGQAGRGALVPAPGLGSEGSSRPVPGRPRCPDRRSQSTAGSGAGVADPARVGFGSVHGSRTPPRHLRSAGCGRRAQSLGWAPPTHVGEKGGAPRLNPPPGAGSARGGEGSGLGGWRGSQPVPGAPSGAAAAAARTAEVAALG
ncbi:uncharacterized protein GJ701_003408 isoform 1-T1 [Geothlypis trichas]